MKFYIACALTHVPRHLFSDYVQFIHGIAAAIQDHQSNWAVRYALVDSDPQLETQPFEERARLCYSWDRDMVEQSDIIIAETSFPSIGLGIEMQIASAQNKPIVVAFKEHVETRATAAIYINPDNTQHELQIGDGYVSLMALGIPSVAKVLKYSTYDRGIAQIVDAVNLIERVA